MHAVAETIAHAKSPQAFRTISEVASDLDVPHPVADLAAVCDWMAKRERERFARFQ